MAPECKRFQNILISISMLMLRTELMDHRPFQFITKSQQPLVAWGMYCRTLSGSLVCDWRPVQYFCVLLL